MRTSVLCGLLFLYQSVWAAYSVFSPNSFAPEHKLSLTVFGAMTHLSVFIILIPLLLLRKRTLVSIKDALPWYGAINSVYVIGNFAFHNRLTHSMGYQGFLDYSGMNSVLIAFCLTVTLFKK